MPAWSGSSSNDRSGRLARWWATARSTVWANTWEARFWIGVGLAGMAYRPLRESIVAIFFMSAYANSKASRSTAEAAKIEMREEEADPHHTGGR